MKRLFLIGFMLALLTPDISADTFYSWRYREHATDCTSLTDGKLRDLCYEIDADTFYKCEPTAGDCSGAEWRPVNTTGNAGTATALAANGADCSAGSYPLGVDSSGAVESCTDATTEINSAIATHAAVTATHGATGAVVGTTNTQTLTNKTLTSPTVNTPSLTLSTTTSTTAGRLFRDASNYMRMGNGSTIENFFPAGTVTDANLCTYDSAGFEFDCNTATSTFQSADADLTTYAGITPSANVQSLLGAADYSAMRTLLGLVIGADVQAYDADLASWAGVTRASGFDTFTGTPSSANLASFLSDEIGNAGGFTRGTAGATNDCVKWDASGNLVSAGAACGSGGSGDNVSVNGAAVTDPNFSSTGQVTFTDSSNTITANVADNSLLEADLKAVDTASDEDILTYESTTGDFEWHTISEMIALMSQGALPNDSILEADLKAVDAASDEECLTYETTTGDFEWQSCGSGGGGATDLSLPVYSAKITGTFALDQDATQGAQIDAGDGNWRLLFDATTDEGAVWQFVMPSNYASTPTLDIDFSMTSGEANEVEFEGAIMCYTAGTDTADVATASFSAIAVGTATTVSATAGEVYRQSITLNDDSCAAGDMVWIYLSTDADDATNDDATGDREVIGVNFNYA